jgi:hypothetical protein
VWIPSERPPTGFLADVFGFALADFAKPGTTFARRELRGALHLRENRLEGAFPHDGPVGPETLMAQDDDSFIREVNEELRSDQFRGAWQRYGRIVIAVAVLIVVGTAGYRGYEYWNTHNSSQSGDRFLAALKLAS